MNLRVEDPNLGAVALPSEPSAAMTLLRGAGIVLAGTVLIAASAHVSIPLFFTPVPITLQPFAVITIGLLLSPRMAFATMVTYLVEGGAGLPVFTPSGPGGLMQLFGLTGGYLLSYPVAAPLISAWWRRGSRTFARGLLVAGVGNVITLTMGATWLGALSRISPIALMNHAVVPFLPGDALKVIAAAGIAAGLARWRRYQG
jgi:biotin transport system substrate-specific component